MSKSTWKSVCVTELHSDTLSLSLPSGCTNYLVPARNKRKWETTGLWITSLNFPPQISSFPTARKITAKHWRHWEHTRAVWQSEKLTEEERDEERGRSREQGRHQGSRDTRWSGRKRKGGIYDNGKKERRKRLTLWNMSYLPFDYSLNILKLYLLCNLWSCLR